MKGADRYPGLRSFGDTELDCRLFFGRNEEAQHLLHQLLSSNLLVLFGKSGVGKTSLVNAGLAALLHERDYLPIPVRFNQTGTTTTPIEVTVAYIEKTCRAKGVTYRAGNTGSLWEFFKTAVFWSGQRLQTPVLILDQFEEIFSAHAESLRHALAVEVGLLTGNRLPEYLRERLQKEKGLPFSVTPPEVKVLISIREDYIGELQDFAPEIPSILQKRFRLTGLSPESAKQAILEPAALNVEGVTFSTRPFDYNPEAVADILRAAEAEDGTVEPLILQIQCRHIEEGIQTAQTVTNQGASVIVDKTYLGGVEGMRELMSGFYASALASIPQRSQRERARRLCEDGLLTEAGHRRSVLQGDIRGEFGVESYVLDLLEKNHLLRKEPGHGSFYYEISHDRVAEAVFQNRRWRLPKKMRMALRISAAVLLAILLVAAGNAISQKDALKRTALALKGERDALQRTELALEDAREALKREELARMAKDEALEREKIALKDRDEALQRRELAITAQDNALRAAKEAQKQAEGEQKRALALLQFIIINKGTDLKAESLKEIEESAEKLYGPGHYEQTFEMRRIMNYINNDRGDRAHTDGKDVQALKYYRAFHDTAEKLAKEKPDDVDLNQDHAIADRNMGDAQVWIMQREKKPDYGSAIKTHLSGIQILTTLLEHHKTNTILKIHLATSFQQLGVAYAAQGNRQAATNSYNKALDVWHSIPEKNRPGDFEKRMNKLKELLSELKP